MGDGRGGREIIARWRAAISGCAVNTKDSRSPAPSLGSPHLPDNATNTHINQIHTQMYNPEIHTKQFKGKPGTHQQQQLDTPADVSATIKKNLNNNPPVIERRPASLRGQEVICMRLSCGSTGAASRGRPSIQMDRAAESIRARAPLGFSPLLDLNSTKP